MKTFKAAGTDRMPSARGQRPRQPTGNPARHSPRGRRHAACACCFSCLLFVIGCGLEGPIPSEPNRDAAAPASRPSEPKPAIAEKAAPGKAAGGERPAAGQKPGMVREKAAVGMGEKGRGYGGGMISVSVMAMWAAKEKIVLDQIHHAMQFYKALEGDGHGPKTKEEFMEKIIKANNIQLPVLPAGAHYDYDPTTEELVVEKPNDL